MGFNHWIIDDLIKYKREFKMTKSEIIKVAICDENKIDCLSISNSLKKVLEKEEFLCVIETYKYGEILCKEHKKKVFDLIFINVELEGISGIETGRVIRDELKDEMVQIAYIAKNKTYAMELFEFHPINFLIKPFIEYQLERVIEKFLLVTKRKQSKFIYKKGYEWIEVNIPDILYFYSQGRKVYIMTNDGCDVFYGKLNHVYNEIHATCFLFIHKSFLINCKNVKKFDNKTILMKNDEILPISQSKRKEVKEIIETFKFLQK